jgi:hypothetical protein
VNIATWFLIDYDNPVHVIRHNHVFIKGDTFVVFRDLPPTRVRSAAQF